MTTGLFLDTSGWFAAINPREPLHQKALAAYAGEVQQGGLLITTTMVAAELHTLLLRFRGPGYALEFLDRIFEEAAHQVVEVDQELRTAAIDRWIRPFQDQRFSLTDAVSFEVMRRQKLRKALALDQHFATAGFEILK